MAVTTFCLDPIGLHSRAMSRISQALYDHYPGDAWSDLYLLHDSRGVADVQVLYAIGADTMDRAREILASGRRYIVVQCCMQTSGAPLPSQWADCWRGALLVWSYYDLRSDFAALGLTNFYFAPLGIDDWFKRYSFDATRTYVVTSGYVTGPGAEAIEEVWIAAEIAGIDGYHVGPDKVQGMTSRVERWRSQEGVSDLALAAIYESARWVAALRHVEGFELPAAEGLASGARAVLFDQPTLRYWYKEHAVYVPDCSGQQLVDFLVPVFRSRPYVSREEREAVIARFDWATIVVGFWARVLA